MDKTGYSLSSACIWLFDSSLTNEVSNDESDGECPLVESTG